MGTSYPLRAGRTKGGKFMRASEDRATSLKKGHVFTLTFFFRNLLRTSSGGVPPMT